MTEHWTRALMCVCVASAITLAGCGGKETTASKSAAAYREAQAKGTPISGGHEHGGHEAEGTAGMSSMAGMDHSTMDHSTMTGMDHSTMDHSTMTGMNHSTTTGMDHAKMNAADHSNMAGMDHPAAQPESMSDMNHSAMPGMQHGAAAAPVAVVTGAPRSSAEIARIEPGTTLQGDEFDAPAATSVEEAQKAAGGGHAGHGAPDGKKEQ